LLRRAIRWNYWKMLFATSVGVCVWCWFLLGGKIVSRMQL
jgi:hypothetical protein